MKRLASPTVVFAAVIVVLTGCAGAAARRPATGPSVNVTQNAVQEFAGTWHGTVAGRDIGGGGITQRARLAIQPDGKWTLSTGGAQSEGTISRVVAGVLELEGRFVPDGGPAGARLERAGYGLTGSVTTRFFGSSVNGSIQLERERAGSVQASPTQPTTAAPRFEGGHFAGTWHGTVAGRDIGGGGITQRARLVIQPDGRWTLTTGGAQSEGTISRIDADMLELEGRFVPDGGLAGARLERASHGLTGSATTRFFGSSVNGTIQLERERGDSIQASPLQPTPANPLAGGEVLQSQ